MLTKKKSTYTHTHSLYTNKINFYDLQQDQFLLFDKFIIQDFFIPDFLLETDFFPLLCNNIASLFNILEEVPYCTSERILIIDFFKWGLSYIVGGNTHILFKVCRY